jgi:hypothetical protein
MITQNLAELLSLPFLVKGIKDTTKRLLSTRYKIPGCRTDGLGVSFVWVISVDNFDVPVEVFRACSGIDLETTLGSFECKPY